VGNTLNLDVVDVEGRKVLREITSVGNQHEVCFISIDGQMIVVLHVKTYFMVICVSLAVQSSDY